MSVGHGDPGIISGLKRFADWLDQSAVQMHTLVEMRCGIPAGAGGYWEIYDGATGTYRTVFNRVHGGIVRDVVGAWSAREASLTRRPSIAEVQSNAGSFFYPATASYDSGAVWDGSATWDGSGPEVWDGSGSGTDNYLYVRLADSSNPNNTTVVAQVGFHFADIGVHHPSLGAEMLTDGDFEVWSSATNLTNWTEVLGSGFTVNREATDVTNGTYSLRVNSDGTATDNADVSHSPAITTFIVGQWYRLTVRYKTDATVGTVTAQIRVNNAGAELTSDGRTFSGTSALSLAETGGEWRVAVLDFIAPATALTIAFRGAASINNTGNVYFDFASLKPIFRCNYYEPRLKESAIPAVESGSRDVFFGGKTIGSGSITFINEDGGLDDAFGGGDDWVSAEAVVTYGGRFVDGSELPWSEHQSGFRGYAHRIRVQDDVAVVDVEDLRALWYARALPRAYDFNSFPSAATKVLGSARPMAFGTLTGIAPPRIGLSPTNSVYGLYELADCTDAPNGIKSVDALYAYLDEEAASKDDSLRRVQFGYGASNAAYLQDLATGRIEIIKNVKPYEITTDNNAIDFDIGGVELTAYLTPGVYIIGFAAAGSTTSAENGLLKDLCAAMNTAAGAGDIFGGSFNDSTKKVTLDSTAATYNIRWNTGTHRDKSIAKALGFRTQSNSTGATSYTGDDAILTNVDNEHIIRADFKGYKDDASGTYTGSASATIEKGGDILNVLIRKFLKFPSTYVDSASIVTARTTAAQALAIYVGNASTYLREVFERLEASCYADVSISGDGVFYFEVRDTTASSDIVDFYDRDYLAGSWATERLKTDVYPSIAVRYAYDSTDDTFSAAVANDATIPVRLRRSEPKTIETYLTTYADAIAIATKLLTLSTTMPRVITFAAKSKLLNKRPGQKIRLTRARAATADGGLEAEVYRILNVSHRLSERLTEVRCVENI